MVHEVLEVVVDGAGKVHHMPRVAVADGGQHQNLFGHFPARAAGDFGGTDKIDIQRQVRSMLLDGAAGHNAHFAQLDGVVDFGPGQFFVAEFGLSAAHGGRDSGGQEGLGDSL